MAAMGPHETTDGKADIVPMGTAATIWILTLSVVNNRSACSYYTQSRCGREGRRSYQATSDHASIDLVGHTASLNSNSKHCSSYIHL